MTLNDHFHRVWMLALMAYREARGEPEEGILAVMFTVKERVENAAKWDGATYVEVITKPFQYSSITDPKDPQQALFPNEGNEQFQTCLRLADKVVAGEAVNPAPGADSYYSVSINPPFWATPERFIKQIGNHRFYKVI